MLETALSYMRDAQRDYAQADPHVKGLWNRTLIERITINGGQLAGVELKQLYHGLFLMASSGEARWSARTVSRVLYPGGEGPPSEYERTSSDT